MTEEQRISPFCNLYDSKCIYHFKAIEDKLDISRITSLPEDLAFIKGEIKNLHLRINGNLDKFNSFMSSGTWWRGAIIGVIFTIIVSVVTFASNFGSTSKQISINTQRLDVIEGTMLQINRENRKNERKS